MTVVFFNITFISSFGTAGFDHEANSNFEEFEESGLILKCKIIM